MAGKKKHAKLSYEDREKIATHLVTLTQFDEKGCVICGSKNLALDDYLVEIPAYRFGDLFSEVSYPCFMTHCGKCGNSQFFKAVNLGLSILEDRETKLTNREELEKKEVENG